MLLLHFAFWCVTALASMVDLDFSSKKPQSIDSNDLHGLYLYRGGEMKAGRIYISLDQLPRNTRVIKEGETYSREIRPDRLTIFVNESGKIIKIGAFK